MYESFAARLLAFWIPVIASLILGYLLGMNTGHVQVIKDDGTICAEIK
jgi:predicted membrane metal-binding protein